MLPNRFPNVFIVNHKEKCVRGRSSYLLYFLKKKERTKQKTLCSQHQFAATRRVEHKLCQVYRRFEKTPKASDLLCFTIDKRKRNKDKTPTGNKENGTMFPLVHFSEPQKDNVLIFLYFLAKDSEGENNL